MFRKPEKANEKIKAMKNRKKCSNSSLSKYKIGGEDIRNYMSKTKLVNSLEVGTIQEKDKSANKPKNDEPENSTQLSPACFSNQIEVARMNPNNCNREMGGKDGLGPSDNLDDESGVVDWDQVIKGGVPETTAVHCCIASEVVPSS